MAAAKTKEVDTTEKKKYQVDEKVKKAAVAAAEAALAAGDKIDKPDRAAFDAELKGLNEKIEECKVVIDSVKVKLDKRQEEKKGKESEVDPDEEKLKQLRAVTKKWADERKPIFETLKTAKDERQKVRDLNDSMQKSMKDAGGCTSVADVDKKIRDLENYLQTNHLSLKEEKTVIGKIKTLNSSKKVIGSSQGVRDRRASAEKAVKECSVLLDANKVELDKARAAEEKQFKIVQGKRKANKDTNEVAALIESRNAARKEMNTHYDRIRKIRDEFRKKDTAFREWQNARRKERIEREKAENDKYQEEKRLRKLQEEEEKAENLHAEAFATIEQLTTLLRGYQVHVPKEQTGTKEPKEQAKPVDKNAPKEVEGRVQIGKAAQKFDDDIFGTKVAKKKSKKKPAKKKPTGVKLDLNLLQEFESLGIDAPVNIEDVPETIKKLTAKKKELKAKKNSHRQERMAKIKAGEIVEETAKAGDEKKKTEGTKEKKDAPAVEADDKKKKAAEPVA